LEMTSTIAQVKYDYRTLFYDNCIYNLQWLLQDTIAYMLVCETLIFMTNKWSSDILHIAATQPMAIPRTTWRTKHYKMYEQQCQKN
jgi:hypothetical protein